MMRGHIASGDVAEEIVTTSPLFPVLRRRLLEALHLGAAFVLFACATPGNPPPRAPGAVAARPPDAPPRAKERARVEPPPAHWRPVTGPPAHSDVAAGLVFPRTLGGLTFRGVQRFSSADLGYGLRYQNNADLWLDVYVYTLGHAGIPDGAAAPEIQRHFGQVEGDIQSAVRAGYYTQLAAGKRVRVVHGGRAFLRGSYSYRNCGLSVASRLYLTGHRGHYLKVRATWWAAMSTAGEAMVEKALDDLATLLK